MTSERVRYSPEVRERAARMVLEHAEEYPSRWAAECSVAAMIGFIDDHRNEYGVEPICHVLPIIPSMYQEYAAQRRGRERMSARAKRDEVLKVEVKRGYDVNFGVYGMRKVWWQLLQEGLAVAGPHTLVSPWMPWSESRTNAGPRVTPGGLTAPIVTVSTSPSNSPRGWRLLASRLRWVAWGIPTTTPWRRPLTDSTRRS